MARIGAGPQGQLEDALGACSCHSTRLLPRPTRSRQASPSTGSAAPSTGLEALDRLRLRAGVELVDHPRPRGCG